jgi:hypothetical protein
MHLSQGAPKYEATHPMHAYLLLLAPYILKKHFLFFAKKKYYSHFSTLHLYFYLFSSHFLCIILFLLNYHVP